MTKIGILHLREWIPSEQCANVQERKANGRFGKKKRKNKPITDAGVHSNIDETNKQQPKINRSRELRRITFPQENSIESPPSVANLSTESILEDLSSGFTEEMDENDNTNVQNDYCNYDDMSTDTDTEDGGRKLLDGVVMTISGYEDPLRGRIVSKAVEMGATYRPGWTDYCSHLDCGFIDTFKYLQAKGKGEIVQGTWIEDCYTFKKKVDWKEYILPGEKADNKPTEEKADKNLTEEHTDNVLTKDTSSKSDGLLFLAGMRTAACLSSWLVRLRL